jgi:hypothetical protein
MPERNGCNGSPARTSRTADRAIAATSPLPKADGPFASLGVAFGALPPAVRLTASLLLSLALWSVAALLLLGAGR